METENKGTATDRDEEFVLTVRAVGAYELPQETFVLLQVEPPRFGEGHTILEQNLLTSPTTFSDLWIDPNGNLLRRLRAPGGMFTFDYAATIRAAANEPIPNDAEEHAPWDLPAETFVYTLPSRYCPSDRLGKMADDLFGKETRGGARVNAVAAWVRENVEYKYGTSTSQTTALDTLVDRQGVCRDFAHLTIAFCRALGIPARYVSGYALGLKPCDFHAYVQAYVGGRWRSVDATYPGVRPALAPIGVGRDAADIAMLTLFGTGTLHHQSVTVGQQK